MNPNILGRDPKTVGDEDFAELAKRQFRALRESIFRAVPDGCFLKMWHTLDLNMVFTLSPQMVDGGLASPKDICSLCSASDCPHNKVDRKVVRILKVKVLGLFFNRK